MTQQELEVWKVIGVSAIEVGGSIVVPPAGDVLDAAVLADPDSSSIEKWAAGSSLTLGAVTGGVAPNAGPFIRAGNRIADALNKLPHKNSLDYIGETHDQDGPLPGRAKLAATLGCDAAGLGGADLQNRDQELLVFLSAAQRWPPGLAPLRI